MHDIYKKPLSSNEYILLFLKEKLYHNIYLCKIILNYKINIENKDTIKYYIERWENIAGEHYYIKNNHYEKFSYIFDSKKYIIKPDYRLQFYKMTGISYQVLELIYELIRIKNENSWDFEINNKDEWVKHDDKLYSILANKIMSEMKKI